MIIKMICLFNDTCRGSDYALHAIMYGAHVSSVTRSTTCCFVVLKDSSPGLNDKKYGKDFQLNLPEAFFTEHTGGCEFAKIIWPKQEKLESHCSCI